MAITITDIMMSSTVTRHTAGRTPDGAWAVTWLPGRDLDRNRAISAMTIAETVAHESAQPGGLRHDNAAWALIDELAAELGLTGPDAVTRASDTLDLP